MIANGLMVEAIVPTHVPMKMTATGTSTSYPSREKNWHEQWIKRQRFLRHSERRSTERDQSSDNDDQPGFASTEAKHERVQSRIECSCFLKNPDESPNYQNEQDYVDRFISPKHGRLQNCDRALRLCSNGVIRAGN